MNHDKALELAKKCASEKKNSYPPAWKNYGVLSQAVIDLHEAVKSAEDVFEIAKEGPSIKWRAIKWLSRYATKEGSGE